MVKEGTIRLGNISVFKAIIQRGNDEEDGQLIQGDVCKIAIKLLFNPNCLKTAEHSADSLLGMPNLNEQKETECFIKIGYFNTQISKLIHEALLQMKINELASISFELDPEILNESFQSKNKQFSPVFLDLKFQIKLIKRVDDVSESNARLEGSQLTVKESLRINEKLIYSISEFDLYELCEWHKQDANEIFKKGFVKTAFERYHKAISFLIISQQQVDFNIKLAKEEKFIEPHDYQEFVKKLSKMKSQLYSNMAACQLRSKRFDMAILNCSNCLSLDGDNVKALFRRGQAYANINEFEKANVDYKKAEQLAPNDADIQKQIMSLKGMVRQYELSQKKYAQNLQKMFKS